MNYVKILQDTFAVFRRGYYEKNNCQINLKTTDAQRQQACVLLPDALEQMSKSLCVEEMHVKGALEVTVQNMDSFTMAAISGQSAVLGDERKKVLVLNFANPVHPGGGAREGARAQEEDLCRKSSLLLSLESANARAYYVYNRNLRSYLGSDAIILTPEVEVIKGANYELLDEPFTVAVMTCAAPIISFEETDYLGEAEYEALLYQRIERMFHTAVYYGYTNLVLGAWGCGAFGNDADIIASLFCKVMRELQIPMKQGGTATVGQLFRRIDFAVLDRSPERYNYQMFKKHLAGFCHTANS